MAVESKYDPKDMVRLTMISTRFPAALLTALLGLPPSWPYWIEGFPLLARYDANVF